MEQEPDLSGWYPVKFLIGNMPFKPLKVKSQIKKEYKMNKKKTADRRNFLKDYIGGVAGLVAASTTGITGCEEHGKKQEPAFDADGKVTKRVDVMVVGGGPVGTIVAIQCARTGAKKNVATLYVATSGSITTDLNAKRSWPGLH